MSGEYLYYPGCSLKGAGAPYERSLLAVFERLGLRLVEIEDWNCCGATAYLSVNAETAVALAVRNLAIAERTAGRDVVAPCSGCFLSLTKAKRALEESPDLRARVTSALGQASLAYRGTARIRHPLEVLMTDLGPAELRKRIVRPLKNLRLAPYYGCAILRPYEEVDDAHTPTVLEELVRSTGATPIDYPYKSRCCGGMLTTGVPGIGLRLTEILLDAALEAKADALVTTCPLCQYNLEVFQGRLKKPRLPILYFTQVLGLALGLDETAVGLDQMLWRLPLAPGVTA